MQRRVLRRAATTAMTVLLLTAITAQADTVPADGDALTTGNQSLVDLGEAAPGQVLTWPIDFTLTCDGLSHVAAGATLAIALSSATKPLDGTVSATPTTIGPVPDEWTPAEEGCPSPAPTIRANAPSIVTLTMPTKPGVGYPFTVAWSRLGGSGVTGTTAITFMVDIVPNTPPILHLPADLTAEATSSAGAAVAWSATASDLEDATPPTPTCAPASGSTFPLGSTTVDCSVVDGGGLTDSGSFLVTVHDTTAPTLAGVPADQSLVTGDLGGASLTYSLPTATDLVDPDPAVGCVPASGSLFPVGTTTVTCTATDDAANSSSDSFAVDVAWLDPVAWSVAWGEPVANSGDSFVANPGRTVPVKVEIFADGVEQTSGDAVLDIATCGGAAIGALAMSWDGGRWTAHLDTGGLGGPGCYMAAVSLDGNVVGSFRFDLRGSATPARRR